MQQVVRLLGDLGERYGTEHTYYDLRTPADAIKLLCINKPKLQEELVHAHEHGVGYRLIQAGTDLGYDDLQLPLGSNDLILTPVVMGSGEDSTTQILVGLGIAVLSFGIGAAFSVGVTLGGLAGIGTVATAGVSIGAAIALGGVAQMLSPQPVLPTLSGGRIRGSGESGSTDGPQSVVRGSDGRQSYMFTGAANTVGVGATIPVVYGEVITGSHLLSAKVEVTDESDPLKTAIKEPGPDTVTVGGEKISGLTYASGFRFRPWSDSTIKPLGTDRQRTITLKEGNAERLADVDYKEDTRQVLVSEGVGFIPAVYDYIKDKRHQNYMILFELTEGLFDYVSGPGTTLVDGFITFEILLTLRSDETDDIDVGQFRVTVQGLLRKNQPYRWMQYIQYPTVDEDLGPDSILTRVTIIDFRCASGCELKIRHNGYELLRDSSHWIAPITT